VWGREGGREMMGGEKEGVVGGRISLE